MAFALLCCFWQVPGHETRHINACVVYSHPSAFYSCFPSQKLREKRKAAFNDWSAFNLDLSTLKALGKKNRIAFNEIAATGTPVALFPPRDTTGNII